MMRISAQEQACFIPRGLEQNDSEKREPRLICQ